jgi:hypothetical protein
MNDKQSEETDETKRAGKTKQADESLKPITAEDLVQPTGDLRKTSAKREWEIKKIQEKLGVSRDIAEKMVDESGGSW